MFTTWSSGHSNGSFRFEPARQTGPPNAKRGPRETGQPGERAPPAIGSETSPGVPTGSALTGATSRSSCDRKRLGAWEV